MLIEEAAFPSRKRHEALVYYGIRHTSFDDNPLVGRKTISSVLVENLLVFSNGRIEAEEFRKSDVRDSHQIAEKQWPESSAERFAQDVGSMIVRYVSKLSERNPLEEEERARYSEEEHLLLSKYGGRERSVVWITPRKTFPEDLGKLEAYLDGLYRNVVSQAIEAGAWRL